MTALPMMADSIVTAAPCTSAASDGPGNSVPLHYTTLQVHRMTALSLRQLQWLAEQGVLCPVQVKHQRRYTVEEAFTALLFRELRARGFSLLDVRLIQKAIRRQKVTLPDSTMRWLLTDGARVVLLADATETLAFLEQRRTPAFHLISLDALARQMQERSDRHLVMRRGPGVARVAQPEVTEERRQA